MSIGISILLDNILGPRETPLNGFMDVSIISEYQNISNKYKQMNFKNNLTDDAIQKLTQISNTLPKIDTNLLKEFINEYKIPIVSSTNDSNSEIKSQQAINEIYT